MNALPYPYRDFERVHRVVLASVQQGDEPYVLVTGETGTGKTALLRSLRSAIDRARFRIVYFQQAHRLGAPGLVRLLASVLRAGTSMYHAVSLDRVVQALGDESQRVLLWFDEAHDLPTETLATARALVESSLDGISKVQVLLVGMPKLRSDLQDHPHLWRRIGVREELCGLVLDEVAPFLDHHFGAATSRRLCERGLAMLFEQAKGSPGLLLPLVRRLLAANPKGKIEPELVDQALQRWSLA
jgi:type II secretory pathway predicted ATPase ExeA